MQNIEQKVKDIIADHMGIKLEKINTQSDFKEDLFMDSMDMVELTMLFEDEFVIEIPDEDAEKIHTVKQAIDYIESKVAKS